jgi:hypothetical protein
MPECEVCGNDYDKAFEVRRGGDTHVFDSFECAIHGIEANGASYCCAHCAEQAGLSEATDRV